MKTWSAAFALISVVACGGTTTSAPSATADGGTAGGGGTAADGGTASDAQTPTPTTPPPTCADCLATAVSWGQNGGLVAYVDTSSLSGCRTYTRSRASSGTPTPKLSCTAELGACSAAPIAVGDVEAALAHADVIAALAGGTTTYGSDSRPCDGAVLSITIGTKTVEVGGDCQAGSPTGCGSQPCVPVPAGVRALASVLEQLDAQEIAQPACAAFK
jgi:hypothetical protein